MPPVRTETTRKTLNSDLSNFKYGETTRRSPPGELSLDKVYEHRKTMKKIQCVDLASQSEGKDIYYPVSEAERKSFATQEGKKVTPHQWAVYDITRKIPSGKVTTYKDLCALLGEGSPRSVGNALRHNPFAPLVPCHRIVSSDLKLGAFCGEWGTENQDGSKCQKKVRMLEQEGVFFSEKGLLVDKKTMLWNVRD